MKKTGVVLAGAIVGAVVLSPVIPAQAVETDLAVPAWKLSFVQKKAIYFNGPGCPASALNYRAGIAMSGTDAYVIARQSQLGYLEMSIKYPRKPWTSPARAKTQSSSDWPGKTFGSLKVAKAGVYKAKLRRVIKNKAAVAPEPALTYGPWSSVKKIKLTSTKIRKTKTIRHKMPRCK